MKRSGWKLNRKRVLRIWRAQGLKVPIRKAKKSRLWLENGRSVRLKPERRNHVWCYDLAYERTEGGRPIRILTVVDEFTRLALAARAARSFTSLDVIEVMGDLMLVHGVPGHIRSDNGPEFIAKSIRQWLSASGVATVYIKPGAPWENAYAESFISRVWDELSDREIFFTLKEAQVMLERFQIDYNSVRPQSALGYLTPLEAIAAAA